METVDRSTEQMESKGSRKTGLRNFLIFSVGALSAAGLLAAVTVLIHGRADANGTVDATPPPAVQAYRVERQDSVQRREVFVGEIEAARANRLAFERAGTIVTVLVDENDPVSRGQTIARLDTAALEANRAALVAERAALNAEVEIARLTRDRRQELNALGHTSAQTFDEARLEYDRAMARRQQVEASIRMVDVDLAKSVLLAPFDGRVTARHLDEGAVVSPGNPVIDLIEDSRPQVRAGLPEAVAASLRVGDVVEVETAAGSAPAVVAAVRADIDQRTRTRIVLLDLDSDTVSFGATADVIIQRPVAVAGFWVPVTALRQGRRGLWTVSTILADGVGYRAGTESVEILFLDGERAYVRGSLANGDEIVPDGTHRLVPGSAVTRVASEG